MAGRLNNRRRAAAAALVAAVAGAHLWLADETLQARLGSGAADARPRRIEVAFARQLLPAAPPPAMVAPTPMLRRPVLAAAAPVLPASAPELIALLSPPPAPSLPPSAPPPAPEPMAEAPPPVVAEAASAPEPAASAAAPAVAVDWPLSTRLTYSLTGNYRGPVEGQAQVEWLRTGTHYQVHLDVSVGPSFAPLLSRRHSSDGEITERGLRPQRYDEEFKVVFRSPRRLSLLFDGQSVHLPNGRVLPQPDGVQDSASQFVQLVWLFTSRPELLTPGRSVDIPLALPRYVETWTYDVIGREALATPVGAVDSFHVKPRREPRPGVELTAEMWVAPALQYLPVRILIRQDAETFVDLLITSLPLQAAPPSTTNGDRR